MSLAAALEFAVRTDPGIVRDADEESIFVSRQQGLAILADGMGGHNAGEVASAMATTPLATRIEATPRDRSAHPMNAFSLRRRRAFARCCRRRPVTAESAVHALPASVFAAGPRRSPHAGTGLFAAPSPARLTAVGDSCRRARRHPLPRALADLCLHCSQGRKAMLDDEGICSTLPASAPRLTGTVRDRGGDDDVSVLPVSAGSRLPVASGGCLAFATRLRQDNGAE